MTARKQLEATKTLLVEDNHGRFKVTIPGNAKVTFGPLVPSGGKFSDCQELTLRIYETQNQQLAAFVGVRWFRDTSLPVERRVVSEVGEESWERDEDGERHSVKVKRNKKFVVDD